MKLSKLTHKIWGCLLGGAIGNAMGSIVENWTYEKIEKTYGKITEPILLDRIKTEDDYQIGMLFSQAYLEYRRNITPEDLAIIWKKHFIEADKFFWCLRNALELLKQGINPRQTGIYNINTGSAIMAISPIGIFNFMEPDRAYADALDLAYMYQPKADAQCAAAMAAGFAEALDPNATVDSIIKEIQNHCLDEDIIHWDDNRKLKNIRKSVDLAVEIADKYKNNWWGARSEIYERLIQWHMIEPIEVLSLVVCLFKMTGGDYLEGVIAGTNIGRDADTIANLIGGLCGCMHGESVIPKDWHEGVQELNMDLYNKFISTAQSFSEILTDKQKKYQSISEKLKNLLEE
jgi:ADP-ribosylglycohydrolase